MTDESVCNEGQQGSNYLDVKSITIYGIYDIGFPINSNDKTL